jgi:hypothetical protein
MLDHPSSPPRPPITNRDRVRALAVFVMRCELALNLPFQDDKSIVDRLDDILKNALSGQLDPDLYERVWKLRKLGSTVH